MPAGQPFTPPPVSAWGTTWRVLLAVLSGFVALGLSLESLPPQRDALVLLDLAAGLVCLVLLFFRRRSPLLVALLATLVGSVSAVSAGAVAVIVISLATRRRWVREVLPVAVVWLGAGYVYDLVYRPAHPVPWWATALIGGFVYVLCVAIGFYIGGQRELLASLELRAMTAEREQAARVDQARTAERGRIAREMHDVLAHRISLVAMHSGGLVYRDDLTREQTVETAEVIRDNAQLALAELREVLGVLRDGEPGAPPERPQPTLAALPELIDEARAAGNPVTCALTLSSRGAAEGDLGALPESTSRSAYRILQEALTNARKHAPGLPVRLEIGGRPGERLVLSARNPVPLAAHGTGGPPPGVGLAGLSERAKLAGGELTTAVERGHFAVQAWLPWPA
ncbi:sensor histidine kinase [Cellulomonas sp. NPDC055163]